MNLLGNIIWLVFGGLAIAVEYFIGGLVLCLTIIGIPFGLQAFKMGLLALFPFGQQTVVTEQGSGCLSTLMNILWFFVGESGSRCRTCSGACCSVSRSSVSRSAGSISN